MDNSTSANSQKREGKETLDWELIAPGLAACALEKRRAFVIE